MTSEKRRTKAFPEVCTKTEATTFRRITEPTVSALAEQVKPIRGKLLLLGIGMSNAAMEFSAFEEMESGDSRVNHSSMAVIKGAQGSMTACAWASAKETPRQHGCKMPRYLRKSLRPHSDDC